MNAEQLKEIRKDGIIWYDDCKFYKYVPDDTEYLYPESTLLRLLAKAREDALEEAARVSDLARQSALDSMRASEREGADPSFDRFVALGYSILSDEIRSLKTQEGK